MQTRALAVVFAGFIAATAASDAADPKLEAAYSTYIAEALQRAVRIGTSIGACDGAYSAGGVHEVGKVLEERCEREFPALYAAKVKVPAFKPVSCSQWALRQGAEWAAAEIDMRVSPLAMNTAPVRFQGNLADEVNGDLVVDAHSADGAMIRRNAGTVVLQGERIKIGSGLAGYGVHTGTQPVRMTSGRATTIPIITAACLEPAL